MLLKLKGWITQKSYQWSELRFLHTVMFLGSGGHEFKCHTMMSLTNSFTSKNSIWNGKYAGIYLSLCFYLDFTKFGFSRFSYFMNRLLCYKFYECLTTLAQGFDSAIPFSFWIGTVIYLRVTVTLFYRLLVSLNTVQAGFSSVRSMPGWWCGTWRPSLHWCMSIKHSVQSCHCPELVW